MPSHEQQHGMVAQDHDGRVVVSVAWTADEAGFARAVLEMQKIDHVCEAFERDGSQAWRILVRRGDALSAVRSLSLVPEA